MTFKKFSQKAEAIIVSMAGGCQERELRQLAESVGAKFEPEPVELPPLLAQWTRSVSFPFPAPEDGAFEYLSEQQVKEVVRRCNAWPELRKLTMAGRYGEVLDVLDGKAQ